MGKHWRVEIHVEGEDILALESDGLIAGISNIEDYADIVRACADHLRAFIGADVDHVMEYAEEHF